MLIPHQQGLDVGIRSKYTYNTIEHLKIPIHIIYAHPLQNSNHKKYEHIHIQVLHDNERGTHIQKSQPKHNLRMKSERDL